MPVNVLVGLGSLLVALVLYSVGTWTAFRRKGFGVTQVVTLWLGFAFDVMATTSMAWRIGRLDFDTPTGALHTTLALARDGRDGDQCRGRNLRMEQAGRSARREDGTDHPAALGALAGDVRVGALVQALSRLPGALPYAGRATSALAIRAASRTLW